MGSPHAKAPDERAARAFEAALQGASGRTGITRRDTPESEADSGADHALPRMLPDAAALLASVPHRMAHDTPAGESSGDGPPDLASATTAIAPSATPLAPAAAAPSSAPTAPDTAAWTDALSRLQLPAQEAGVQRWHFSFAPGNGPLSAITLQAEPGAPWALQIQTPAQGHERAVLAARLDELRTRLDRRGTPLSRLSLLDDEAEAP